MTKSIKKCLTYVVIITILSAFAGSGQGIKFESKYGLPMLYKLRNAYSPPSAPSNIFIFTPYKTRKAGKPDELRDWDRKEHADIISKLSELNVSVIAMDIYFRDPHPQQDDFFAREITKAGNVILNQLARPIEIDGNNIKGHILRNPTEPLSSSVAVLAPVPVLPEQTRIDAIFSFHQIIYDQNKHRCYGYLNDADLAKGFIEDYGKEMGTNFVATLPVAALEQYLMASTFIKKDTSSALNKIIAELNQSQCESIVDVRKKLANNPVLIDQLSLASKGDKAFSSWLMLIKQLSLENLRNDNQTSFNLNYYGTPQTLQTLEYDAFLQDYELILENKKVNQFEHSIIFFGGSFNEPADQNIDDFNTVFTKGELQMSGVEIAATGFANLYNNNYLVRHNQSDAFLATLFVCICISLLSFLNANKTFVFMSIGIVLSYLALTVYQFSSHYFWPPFIIPILAIVLITLYELFDRFYLTSIDKIKLEENLKLYLSSTVANQVAKDKAFEMENAICLVTDVAGFTSIGEALAAEKLHTLNREYFELLFDCVTDCGADVIKTYGDSLTAVWKIKDQTSYTQAVKAGLMILSQVEKFNSKNQETPFNTRIGMSSGQIVIGYVGGDTHRTVELTGDAIYTASRLEQLNKQTKTNILATREFNILAQGITSNIIGKKQLRGKSGYTDIIEVLSIKL